MGKLLSLTDSGNVDSCNCKLIALRTRMLRYGYSRLLDRVELNLGKLAVAAP